MSHGSSAEYANRCTYKKFTTYLVVVMITVIVVTVTIIVRSYVCVSPVLKCFWRNNILLNLSKYLDFIYFEDKIERGVLLFCLSLNGQNVFEGEMTWEIDQKEITKMRLGVVGKQTMEILVPSPSPSSCAVVGLSDPCSVSIYTIKESGQCL